MEIEIETIDSCNKKLKLVIPNQKYQKEIDVNLKKLAKQVDMKGFRKGKVPKSILEKRYGPEVKREVLTKLVSNCLMQAIQEKELQAVSPPSLLNVEAEEGTDITVSATVEIVPEFEIKDYSTLEIEMKVNKVTEKERDEVIEVYRERHSQPVPIVDRGAEENDYIKMDYVGTIDSKPFEGGEGQDYEFQIGSQKTLAGFDDGVLGMKPGDEKDLEVTFPDTHLNKTLAGKTVNFHIKVKDLYFKELPELTDEFAQIANLKKKYISVDDMKTKIMEELESYERKEAKKEAKKVLAEKLADENPLDIPEALVMEQIKFMAKDEKAKEDQAAGKKGHDHQHDHDHDHDHDDEPVTPEQEQKFRESSVRILQQELILGKLAKDLDVEVTAKEVDEEIQGFVQMVGGGDAKALKREWQKSGALEKLHARMKREKTLDAVLEKVVLKEEMVDRA